MVATVLSWLNYSVGLIFSLVFFYQFVYIFIAAIKKHYAYKAASCEHSYAFLICAHNEEQVIAELIASIKQQDYPADKIKVFCVADNCSDRTALRAEAAGAEVLVREDLTTRGKSWVMRYGFQEIFKRYPGRFEGIFIFDADNILRPDYVRRMNEVFDEGYEVITSYRNSKNFESSWISAAYALWFMREAKFLNNARMILGTSCAISGTGYLLSTKLLQELGDWNFHLLTEDIEFSAWFASQGRRIAYAHHAEFFDEQPISFAASWKQRMRWTKGFYQVFWHYGKDLVKAMFRGHFAGFDLLMTIAPAMILTISCFILNALALGAALIAPQYFGHELLVQCIRSLSFTLGFTYLMFFMLGLITTIFERKRIYACLRVQLLNLFSFPIFMLTYIPIALVALVKQVEWVPTKHTVSKSLDEIVEAKRELE